MILFAISKSNIKFNLLIFSIYIYTKIPFLSVQDKYFLFADKLDARCAEQRHIENHLQNQSGHLCLTRRGDYVIIGQWLCR